jgi:hypothetical protein
MKKSFPLLFLAVLALATGCVSTVSVTSDTPGALVRYRGKGRPSYRWKTAGLVRKPGDVCTFRAPYSAVDVYACWDEGKPTFRETETVTVPLSNWRDPDTVHLNAPR